MLPRRLRRPFTYLVPDELKGKVEIGQSVIVPFGTQALHGLVIAVYSLPPAGAPGHALKALYSLADGSSDLLLTSSQIALSRWVADRYAAPWGQCIKLVLPPVSLGGRVQPRYLLKEPMPLSLSSASATLNEMEVQLLKRLSRYPKGLTERALSQADRAAAIPALQALLRKGLIMLDTTAQPQTACSEEVTAPKKEVHSGDATLGLPMDPPVEAALWSTTLGQAISKESFVALLVHAGHDTRRWCLMQAVQATRRRGRGVLIITGDVEGVNRLATALVGIGEQPLQLHSGLSARNRAHVWSMVRRSSTTMVIGTRMAAFAPIENLGLVWVEGEDDASLKEEQIPHYHAREIAKRRAVCDQALLVLASSHPSLESWSAVQQGEMMACVYRDRTTFPQVQVIDLKDPTREFTTEPMMTPLLYNGLREALRQQAPAFVYLNRKGFAAVLHCRDCGAMPRCNACTVTLAFYKRDNLMRCHYCGRTRPVPDHCIQCRSLKLEPVGSGTERLEETVRRMFPQARIARVDGETIRRSSDARAFHRLLAAGDLDIVIGTQKLFHLGLHGKATYVAVPEADAGLHVPDFRSAERMYQTLVDAIELARPAQSGGVVSVQTRFTDHHAIKAAAQGEDSLFVEQELIFRRMLHYPPHRHLVKLDVSGMREPVVAQAADRWARLLREESRACATHVTGSSRPRVPCEPPVTGTDEDNQIVILGPSPAAHARTRGRHHWQILMKVISLDAGRDIAVRTVAVLERGPRPGALRFDIDVDPITMG